MNILLIDDDILVTESLKTILEVDENLTVIATGSNGQDAIDLYKKYEPDLLLMDIRMANMNGIEAASIILNSYPNAKILFLTTFSDDEYIIKALKIGAKGYILKQNFTSIIPSVKAVISGQTVFGNEIVNKIPNLIMKPKQNNFEKYDLTEKEIEIISKIADGLSNKEISEILFLSEGTIRNYISIILEKLNLRDRTQIAIFYYKN